MSDTPPTGSAAAPIAEWKLMIPRRRKGLVDRPRLFAMLDRRDEAALTLISAPAGSGKTDLVSGWLRGHQEWSVAWVTLDEGDADPIRFWTYVAQAIDRVRPGMARPALAQLHTPGTRLEEAIDELMNGARTFKGRLVLVLDDLHRLTTPAAVSSFAYAVERAAEPIRIVATTRSDPPMKVGRLRARGMLAEVRGSDLAFDVREARQLLGDTMGIRLDVDEISLLVTRTEGWAAGLSLAGLWLSEVDEPSRYVRDFAGGQRQVADYLTDEVLGTIDETTRAFLLRTSVLDRFSASLCDAALGIRDSHAMLSALSRSNLFLVPLDQRGEWYRYHQLFGELLRLELARLEPAMAQTLHARAADWFLDHGLLGDALEHGAAAGDPGKVVSLLVGNYLPLLRTGQVQLLLRWLGWLSDEQLREQGELAAAGAISSAMLGRPAAERVRLARLAEASVEHHGAREKVRVQALVGLARGGSIDRELAAVLVDADRAVALAREDGDQLVIVALGVLAYARYLRGDLEGADAATREALDRPELSERPHGLIVALACAALIDVDRGQSLTAERRAREALDAARHLGLAASWSSGAARVALGAALLLRGQAVEAEQELERAERLRRNPHPALEHVHALLLLGEARVARGRLALAASEIAAAREQLGAFSDAGRLPAMAQRVEQALADALSQAGTGIEAPTPAELLVLRLLATDLSQREVGEQLFLSINTVKSHTRTLYRKLGATTRADAVRRATQAGLLDLGGSPG